MGAAVFALRLEPSASTDTLVNRSSSSFKATESFKREFGDDAVVILVKGDLERTLLTSDLATLIKLEGCLSGNVPAKSTLTGNGHVLAVGLDRMPSECRQLARTKPVKVVYGPGTFTNTAAERISQGILSESQAAEQPVQRAENAARQLAKAKGYTKAQQNQLAGAAANLALNQYIQQALQLAVKYGLTTAPSIDNTDFVSQLWFDPTRGVNVPKARFAFLAPSPHAALIQVRLKPNLSNQQHRQAISLIARATKERFFQLNNGQRYVVSGVPVVADALGAVGAARDLRPARGGAARDGGDARAGVQGTRCGCCRWRSRWRRPALAFGAAGAGGRQAHDGVGRGAAGADRPGGGLRDPVPGALRGGEPHRAAARAGGADGGHRLGGPTIATAGLATAVGFLVLLLSPVPMVRGFGGCSCSASCWRSPARSPPASRRSCASAGRASAPADVPPRPRARAGSAAAAAGSVDRAWACLRRTGTAALEAGASLRPRKVLAVGLALAVLGWAADTQTKVISDVRELVPQDLPGPEGRERAAAGHRRLRARST